MFSCSLRNATSTRRYSIGQLSDAGWEVTLEREGDRLTTSGITTGTASSARSRCFAWKCRN